MHDFSRMAMADRRVACGNAARQTGMAAHIIEKDFWVCWTLRLLFSLDGIAPHLVFKGGTSLSKGWKLIDRFSEDVDVVIDRTYLGFPGDHSLRSKQLSKLREACVAHVRDQLRPRLSEAMRKALGEEFAELTDDPQAPAEPTLLFPYPTAYPGAGSHMRAQVKLEFGARSDTWPAEQIAVLSDLGSEPGSTVAAVRCEVRALRPERTCLEKAMLLHEERQRPATRERGSRMSRHYYDLHCLVESGVAGRAAADASLVDSVAAHRKVFFRQSWVDYSTHARGSFSLLPSEGEEAAWRADYRSLADEFVLSPEAPSWASLMRSAKEMEDMLNRAPAAP